MVQGVTTALTLGIGQLRPDPIESGDFCIEPVDLLLKLAVLVTRASQLDREIIGALPLTRRLMLIVLFVVKSEHGGYLARPDLAVKRSLREASHGTL